MYIQFVNKNAASGLQAFSRNADAVPRIGDKIRVEHKTYQVTDVVWEDDFDGDSVSPIIEIKLAL